MDTGLLVMFTRKQNEKSTPYQSAIVCKDCFYFFPIPFLNFIQLRFYILLISAPNACRRWSMYW